MNDTYNEYGELIQYKDKYNKDVIIEYDSDGKILYSKTDNDMIKYAYDNNDKIINEYVYSIFGNKEVLLRTIWLYYHPDGYLDHIVSDDGIDFWLDRYGNEVCK